MEIMRHAKNACEHIFVTKQSYALAILNNTDDKVLRIVGMHPDLETSEEYGERIRQGPRGPFDRCDDSQCEPHLVSSEEPRFRIMIWAESQHAMDIGKRTIQASSDLLL